MSASNDTTPLKRCTKCGREFPATTEFFYAQPRRKYGLHSYCKSCHLEGSRANAKAWNAAHPERYAQSQARYYPKLRAKMQKYYRDHPEINRNNKIKRKARKLNLACDFTQADWQCALDYFGGCCAVCGRPQGLWHRIAQDHWIPLSNPNCPGTVPKNIIPLCHSLKNGEQGCNNSKHDRAPEEWLIFRLGPKKAKRKLAEIQAYLDSRR